MTNTKKYSEHLMFISNELSCEQASLNRKLARHYVYHVTIGSIQLGISVITMDTSSYSNTKSNYKNYGSSKQSSHLKNFANSKLSTFNSASKLNEIDLYNSSKNLNSQEVLLCLRVYGGEQKVPLIRKLFAWFGIILSGTQGVKAFMSRLFSGSTNSKPPRYVKPGNPGDDLTKTAPCNSYGDRNSSSETDTGKGRRKESSYEVPPLNKLTYEEYHKYIQCQKKYQLSKLERRMLPSKKDRWISLSGTDIDGVDLSDYELRISWGQSDLGRKDIKHGHIFNLKPKKDINGTVVARVNTQDPDEPIKTPISATGQQELWHKRQIAFCKKYKNHEVKTNIKYLPKADGTFDEGGIETGLVIFDRKRNIMIVARPDYADQAGKKRYTVATVISPTQNEIAFYDKFGIVIPGDKESYNNLKSQTNDTDLRCLPEAETSPFTEQESNAQCLEPKMEIVNIQELTKKDN